MSASFVFAFSSMLGDVAFPTIALISRLSLIFYACITIKNVSLYSCK